MHWHVPTEFTSPTHVPPMPQLPMLEQSGALASRTQPLVRRGMDSDEQQTNKAEYLPLAASGTNELKHWHELSAMHKPPPPQLATPEQLGGCIVDNWCQRLTADLSHVPVVSVQALVLALALA